MRSTSEKKKKVGNLYRGTRLVLLRVFVRASRPKPLRPSPRTKIEVRESIIRESIRLTGRSSLLEEPNRTEGIPFFGQRKVEPFPRDKGMNQRCPV